MEEMAKAQSLATVDRDAAPGASVCRHCAAPLRLTMVDLGKSPLCQTVLTDRGARGRRDVLSAPRPGVRALLARPDPELAAPEEIFTEYAYFSAYSDSWVEHARTYVEEMCERLSLGPESLVVELASNDGYLLQHFLPKRVPVLGIEPALNVAEAAVARGVETITEFFGAELGARSPRARARGSRPREQRPRAGAGHQRLRRGRRRPARPVGTATFEFPHLAKLVEHLEYDTIYHEHFSYFSLHSIRAIFGEQGLDLVDVQELESHGGSLRVFLRHGEAGTGRRRPWTTCSRARTSRDCATPRRTRASRRACASPSARSSTS